MDVFKLFTTSNYTFLELESSLGGNKVLNEFEANGIFKMRSGLTQIDNVETYGGASAGGQSLATLHIRASEPFVGAVGGELTGHGVRVNNPDGQPVTYRIEGWKPGLDYDTGELSFYLATLKRENLWEPSDLPLE